MKWDVRRLALTGGIIWAVAMFLTTIAGLYFGYGDAFLNSIASIYPGYSVSFIGAFVGLVYGFLDVFVGVYIFAWVYRQLGKSGK